MDISSLFIILALQGQLPASAAAEPDPQLDLQIEAADNNPALDAAAPAEASPVRGKGASPPLAGAKRGPQFDQQIEAADNNPALDAAAPGEASPVRAKGASPPPAGAKRGPRRPKAPKGKSPGASPPAVGGGPALSTGQPAMAQPAMAQPATGGPATGQPAAEAMAPLQNVATTAGAADSLLRWLAEADASLDGKRLALVDLLSRVYGRPQQAQLVAAYWKLSAAESEYRIAADESLRLGQLLPPANAAGQHASAAALETRLAAAEARVREAELAVLSQQYGLAEQMRLPTNEPLPLTADLPHAGAYRTYFQERYAQIAPPRGRLIDRTLPLLHRSIELRAAAALSAADSADAEAEAYHAGQLDLTPAADSVAELTRQRRAFVAAVRDYNLDIAEYALSVVPPGLSGAQLVGVLIGPQSTAEKSSPDPQKHAGSPLGGVNQAVFEAPLAAPSRPVSGVPTLAPPRTNPLRGPPANNNEPRQNAAPPGARRPRLSNPSSTTSGDTRPRIKSVSPGSASRRAVVGRRHVAAKPPSGPAPGDDPQQSAGMALDSGDRGLYSALRDLSPLKRAQELSALLHWDRQATEAQSAAVSLADALSASAGADRGTLIEAYWRGRERVAASQVVRQEAELLQAAQSAALRLHAQPGGAESMLRLRTAQLAASAANEEAEIGVLSAQFDLAQLMRRPLSGPWPWPITPPHAGGYRLKLDEQPGAVLQTSLVQHIGRSLPVRHEVVERWSDAVVSADAARVQTALDFEAGQRPLTEVVAAVQRLSRDTLAFLEAQTEYNLRFAEYVLAVAPPGIPNSTLAGALVVSR